MNPAPFQCDKCDHAAFPTERGLIMHKIRKHSGKNWDSSKNLRKRTKKSMRWTPQRRANYKAMIAKKNAKQFSPQAFYNGVVAATTTQTPDQFGDAAKAIMLSAKVLRAVATGLKIP